jgi:hypothetical protein
MFKKLAYAGAFIGAVAAAAAVGCGGGGTKTTVDFAMNTNTDGSANTDAHVTNYFSTTVHAIDTATIGDPNMLNLANTPVAVSGLIVLAEPTCFSAKITVTGDGCRCEVWAQDPQCTTPPCGIILETQAAVNPMGTGAFCPFANALDDPKNVLKDTNAGDVINAQGVVDNFPKTGSGTDGGTSATLNSHQVELDTVTTTTPKGSLPAATVVTDTNPSMFVPYSGAGWTMYEGMLIKLQPPSGKFTSTLNVATSDTCPGVTYMTNGSFSLAPGGANFEDTYNFLYIEKDAGEATNCWPTNGLMFSSVGGIVSTTFGGGILPISPNDFQP